MGIIAIVIAMMSTKLVLYRHLHGPADNQGTLHTYVCLVLSVALVLVYTCYYSCCLAHSFKVRTN